MMKNYIFIFVAAIMLLGVQNSVNAADYVLTVTGGTGSGTYAEASVANIVAAPAASGEVFDRWVITAGAPTFGSIYNATTTLTMPTTDVSIAAVYMPDGPYFDDCEATVPSNGTWARTGLTLNAIDMVQGAGCLDYDQVAGANSTTLFLKTITAGSPINTGATLANGMLRLRFWIEDPTKLGALLCFELRSGTEAAAEHQWNIPKANVVAGWNNFNLKFSAVPLNPLGPNFGCDPTAVTFFRTYSTGAVGVKAKLDGLMVFDPTVTKVDPIITWANPADVAINTALSGTQLNATANILGTFAYTPANATVLTAIETKQLSVTFTPINLHAFLYNSVTRTVDIKVVESTAVNNPTESAFSIYPNPLKSNGILNINVAEQDNYTLRISNMNGQTVYSSNLNGSQSLNVNGVLKQGAYIVSLFSSKSTRNQKLFIE
jgi:hypothetical protein